MNQFAVLFEDRFRPMRQNEIDFSTRTLVPYTKDKGAASVAVEKSMRASHPKF
jgi:hypothetical protein